MNLKIINKIINSVVNKYVNSPDFNGISAKVLLEKISINEKQLKDILKKLIQENKLSISLYINPYIKAFDDPIDKQINFLNNKALNEIVIYPTRSTLKEYMNKGKYKDMYKDMPFSRMLLEGYPQFHPCYFETSVLERYKSDPRYILYDDGTSLSLSIKDKFYFSTETLQDDKITIQTFGYAYSKSSKQKVIMVFLRYLHNISSRHQKHWESHQITGQFLMDKDYFARSFLGEFTKRRSIYEALLEEEKQINLLSRIIGKPPLFKKEYKFIPHFSVLPKPTARYYNAFIHLLDKLISENINKKFFEGDIELKDEKGEDVGTLRLLENWIRKYFKPHDPQPLEEMFETFKKIRKQRQIPAHAIDIDEYDTKYFELQEETIKSAYIAMQTLRLILCNHPKIKSSNYRPPDWLQYGEIKF